MKLLRSGLAWLHRSWTIQLVAPSVLALALLLGSWDYASADLPGWVAAVSMLAILAVVASAFILHHLARAAAPRRDRNLPTLQQVSNDLREDVPMEERLGMKKIPLPPPPPAVEMLVRTLGRPLPRWADRCIEAALLVSFSFCSLNAVVPPGTTGGNLQPLWELMTFGLDRWSLALISAAAMTVLSYRVWAADVRKAFEDGSDRNILEAYG